MQPLIDTIQAAVADGATAEQRRAAAVAWVSSSVLRPSSSTWTVTKVFEPAMRVLRSW